MSMIEVDNQVALKLTSLANQLGTTRNNILRTILFREKTIKTSKVTKKPTIKIPIKKPREDLRQRELIDPILKVLYEHGGKAKKHIVDKQLFNTYREVFIKPFYQELVSTGVPRWKHYIAWAKEAAKQKYGYIKPPSESGWGMWELTEKGKNYCERKLN